MLRTVACTTCRRLPLSANGPTVRPWIACRAASTSNARAPAPAPAPAPKAVPAHPPAATTTPTAAARPQQQRLPPLQKRYVRWWWEMIFPSLSRKGNEAASTATTTTDTGTPVMTMEERRRELGVDSNNLATFMKDVRELRAMGGKYYEARSELSAPEISPRLPNITGRTLSDRNTVTTLHDLCRQERAAATLVLFKFKDNGEKHLRTYRDPFLKAFPHGAQGSTFPVQLVDVVITERQQSSFIQHFQTRSLLRQTLASQQSKTLLHSGAVTDLRLQLKMVNALVGWAFLVDARGRVRWHAHGPATEREVATLLRLARELTGES